MGKYKDLTGKKFGRLTCLKDVGRKDGRYVLWLCRCDCGKMTTVVSGSLISGNTSSCGCLKREIISNRNKVHSLSVGTDGKKTRLYSIWIRMKQRCFDSNADDFTYYGGRGISVCKAWLNYKNFYDWAISNGYEKNLTIEREDVNGNYDPSNCTWISREAQARNKRNNHFITYQGRTKTLAEWSEIMGMESSLIRYRLKAWGIERAFNQPIRGHGKCV